MHENNNCALILGGGLNGYRTARELAECHVKHIILVNDKCDYAFYSNKIWKKIVQPPVSSSIISLLEDLHKTYNYIVLYPVSDIYITELKKAYPYIADKRGIIYNPEVLENLYKKSEQYEYCALHNIAHPKTMHLCDYYKSSEKSLQYPLLIKPNCCDNNNYSNVFKTMVVKNENELSAASTQLNILLDTGIDLLITEVIPGEDEALYGYVGYRSKEGIILSEWGWRKLSQFPENYGVFASITNQCPEDVMQLGREIFEKMDLWGINEIEFKYDYRDGKYKYIETNFRTPMLSRLGHLTGVSTCYTQYLDSTGLPVETGEQNKMIDVHYVLFQAELINFLKRPKYISKLARNIFKSNKTYFAIFDIMDPLPAIFNVFYMIIDAKKMIRRFL